MRTLTLALGLLVTGLAAGAASQGTATDPGPRFSMRVVTSGLDAPWELTLGPDGQLWVTERKARRVVRVDPVSGTRRTALTIPEAHQSVSQDGLLGLALHPALLRGTGADYVYLTFTYDDGAGPSLVRRMTVRRYQFEASTGTLSNPLDILAGLPSHDDHVGGRLAIGPDLKLYLSIGDQGSNFGQNRCVPNRAQDLPSAAAIARRDWSLYAGKILRLELDGSIPSDNPLLEGVRSHVFSYGHRNPLGLAFGPTGLLYESEHGPSTDDEVNLIEAGRNYGWPHVAGYRDAKSYVFSNWSASAPDPCATLPAAGPVPPSVPSQTELAWSHPQFAAPLRTFFTVDTGTSLRGIGSATIAPGGLDVYTAPTIPAWRSSLLALSLIRGVVYRLRIDDDGRSVVDPPQEVFRTANRYRDIAIDPGGRTVYLATDSEGPSRDDSGALRSLEHPGSILAFTYEGPRPN